MENLDFKDTVAETIASVKYITGFDPKESLLVIGLSGSDDETGGAIGVAPLGMIRTVGSPGKYFDASLKAIDTVFYNAKDNPPDVLIFVAYGFSPIMGKVFLNILDSALAFYIVGETGQLDIEELGVDLCLWSIYDDEENLIHIEVDEDFEGAEDGILSFPMIDVSESAALTEMYLANPNPADSYGDLIEAWTPSGTVGYINYEGEEFDYEEAGNKFIDVLSNNYDADELALVNTAFTDQKFLNAILFNLIPMKLDPEKKTSVDLSDYAALQLIGRDSEDVIDRLRYVVQDLDPDSADPFMVFIALYSWLSGDTNTALTVSKVVLEHNENNTDAASIVACILKGASPQEIGLLP